MNTKKTKIAVISLYALENNGVRHIASSLREAGYSVTEIYFKDWVNNNFHLSSHPTTIKNSLM